MEHLTNVFDERQWSLVTSYWLLVASIQSPVMPDILLSFMDKISNNSGNRNNDQNEKVFFISLSPQKRWL